MVAIIDYGVGNLFSLKSSFVVSSKGSVSRVLLLLMTLKRYAAWR